jgi:hypothetical protein
MAHQLLKIRSLKLFFDAPTGNQIPLTYAAANLDPESQAKMLVRNHARFGGTSLIDRVEVPRSVWSYVDNKNGLPVDRKNAFLAPYESGRSF